MRLHVFLVLLVASCASRPFDAESDATTDAGPTVLLGPIDAITIDENELAEIAIPARAGARVFLLGAPPGTRFDESARMLRFTPDFIQGGRSYSVTVVAIDADERAEHAFTITVRDSIHPPDPVIISTTDGYMLRLVRVRTTTDAFLDPPGLAGRTFDAIITIPDAATDEAKLPVRINLHGSGGMEANAGDASHFGIGPGEPLGTWWAGQSERLPEAPTSGRVYDYSQRRILHLLDWLDRTYEGVDRAEVVASGQSKGGVGALWLAVRHGRHIASTDALLAMTSARLMESGQRTSLEAHWGLQSTALLAEDGHVVWDSYDVMRALEEDPDARDVFYRVDNAKNDELTTFLHWVVPSPSTGLSFVQALASKRVGHLLGWDQRNHSSGTPFWQGLDRTSRVRSDSAFPAFSHSSADDDPGEHLGALAFSGDAYGVINRYFEWDAAGVEDTFGHFAIRVRLDAVVVAEPTNGRPPEGDGFAGALPIRADITIRRAQRFRCLPNERVRFRFTTATDTREGEVTADTSALVTVSDVAIPIDGGVLMLERTDVRSYEP